MKFFFYIFLIIIFSSSLKAEINVGILLGFTGPIESLTPAMRDGAKLAFSEASESGRETAKVFLETEHGLFSYYLMKGIEGNADFNSDNQITNGELQDFISKNVSRLANQSPQFKGDINKVLIKW